MINNKLQTKRIGQSAAMLAVAVAVLGVWAAGAGAQMQITNPILIPNEPYHVSAGDFNGDGLYDYVVSHTAGNVVDVWQALDENSFTLAESLEVPEAAGVLAADFDGDGVLDIAVGSYLDSSITIAYGVGDFCFVLDNANSFIVDVSPGVLSIINQCELVYPDLLVANSPEGTVMHVASPAYDPVVILVTKSFELAGCGTNGVLGPCNNYTIPPCNPNAAGQGIQECVRAALCRARQCNWAACIEYEDGGFLRDLLYTLQLIACGAALDYDLTFGCLTPLGTLGCN